MTGTTVHHVRSSSYGEISSISSADDFDWSSDSQSASKRKTSRKTKADSSTAQNATDNPLKKAKKPGRKPLAKVTVLPSDPKLKRKAQNRAAQRAFRERKEQFVNELQDQMRELRAEKERREKELAKENARLKKENERLKEENYILKDAKFTFECPPNNKATTKKMISSATDDQIVSVPDSPLSYIPDGGSGGVGGDDDDVLSDYQSPTKENTSFDQDRSSSKATTIDDDNSDLFHQNNTTARDLFSLPSHYSTNDEPTNYINVEEPLPQLFGNEMDIFDIENPAPFQLDPLFSEQLEEQAPSLLGCAPENEKPCKTKILAVLKKAKGANRSAYQVNQDVRSYCPDFNMDQLCEDLSRKVNFDQNRILTDEDVDLYIDCIKKHT